MIPYQPPNLTPDQQSVLPVSHRLSPDCQVPDPARKRLDEVMVEPGDRG